MRRAALTKVDRAAVRADDALFLGVDLAVRQTPLTQFLLFQLSERHRDGRQVRAATRPARSRELELWSEIAAHS